MGINVVTFGQGYVASILQVGVERIKRGEIEPYGVPFQDRLQYKIRDIEFVASFDVNRKKVGKKVREIVPRYWNGNVNLDVEVGKGYADPRERNDHVGLNDGKDLEECAELLADEYRRVKAEVFVNVITTEYFKPFESREDFLNAIEKNDEDRISPAQFYFYSVLKYGRPCAFINCIPTAIANDPALVSLAEENEIVLFGDDGASGATPLTTDILEHMSQRKRKVLSIAQFNIGGNDDFLSLEDPRRNITKEMTKSKAVKDILGYDAPHFIKPTGYLEPLGDKKFVSMHIPYLSFNGAEDELIINMRINDSPALAGLIVDMIRIGKICLDRRIYGTVYPVNAFYMKMPGPRGSPAISKMMAFKKLEEWLRSIDAVC